jgi:hypothetical protein
MTAALLVFVYGLATAVLFWRWGYRAGRYDANDAWLRQSEREVVCGRTPRALRAAKRRDECCRGK